MKFTALRSIGQGLGKFVHTFNGKTCESEANLGTRGVQLCVKLCLASATLETEPKLHSC